MRRLAALTLSVVVAVGGAMAGASPAAAQTVVYSNDFSLSAGSEWSPSATIFTLPLGEKMLGNPFGNVTESLTLTGLPAHAEVTISFDLYILRSWDGNGEFGFGPDFWKAAVAGGPTLQPTTTFANPGCSGFQSYPAPYLATFPATTGAAAVGTLGFGAGCFGDSTYHFEFTFAHTASSIKFDFSASNLQGWADEGWGLDNVVVLAGLGPPATLTLEPKEDANTVDSEHCVTATVKDASGNPTPGITVPFSVSGSVNTSGSVTTDANGQATFCYTGPALPGADVITAYADTNNNAVQDADEPSDTATKQWVLPASTDGCKVTYGGRITAANGDKATFGGNAQVPAGQPPKGQEEYQDHGPVQPMNVHSINVQAVVCSADGTQASIFGQATIDGSGTFDYRIDLKDLGEPGTSDTYRIRLSTGYDSGEQVLQHGNVQIHFP